MMLTSIIICMLRYLRVLPRPNVSRQKALDIAQRAAEGKGLIWQEPSTIRELLRTYVVWDIQYWPNPLVRVVIDAWTGYAIDISTPGYPIRYLGRPIGSGPWVSPQEAGEIANREAVKRFGSPLTPPVEVAYSYIERCYVVSEDVDRRGGRRYVMIDPRDGSIRRYVCPVLEDSSPPQDLEP